MKIGGEDFVCLTDMAKLKSEDPSFSINHWMRNRMTIEYLGLWEELYNPNFKPTEFGRFREESGLNSFTLSPTKWIQSVNAIGIVAQSGRHGGTYARNDIAFKFAAWLSDLKIGYCTGCYACQKTGKCAIKDDAQGVIDKMMAAEVIVLASPVYFYTICAQLKALIDRTVVVYPNLANKKFYYLLTMADTNRTKFDGSLAALRGFLDCCEGSEECGRICADGVYERGTVNGTKFVAEAKALGKSVA